MGTALVLFIYAHLPNIKNDDKVTAQLSAASITGRKNLQM
jgi:hypothetical protein